MSKVMKIEGIFGDYNVIMEKKRYYNGNLAIQRKDHGKENESC